MHKALMSMILLMGLVLSTAACQPAFSQGAVAQPTPPPLTGKAASRLGRAALTIQQQAGIEQYSIIPVSADTGQPVKDAQPVPLGGGYTFGFSKDRSQLAFLSNQSLDCLAYCLYLMDLQTWKAAIKPVPLDKSYGGWFLIPVFDEKSARLPVIVNGQTETASTILLVNLAQGSLGHKQSLPANIMQAAYTPTGQLAVYGIQTHTTQSGLESFAASSGATAYLALLDGQDLHLLWEKTLPEIQFAAEWSGDLSDPTQGKYLTPAGVFSSDGSKLYLVAADKPLLVTVDFTKQTIHSAHIQPRASLLDRLMAATAGVVYAKTFNGVSKIGVLSQDGRYLYVVGQETKAVKNDQGDYRMEASPLGMQIIDTQDGTLVSTISTEANDAALSLDGKTLLLSGWRQEKSGDGYPWTDVLDIHSQKVIQHLDGTAYPSRLLDGSLVWLVNKMSNDNSSKIEVYRPGESNPRGQISRSGYVDWIPIP